MLHEETVEPATLGLLKKLFALPELTQYRLAGGTALSLLLGHRKSIDLDFFTDQNLDKESLIPALQNTFREINATNDRSNHIYQCIIDNVKVDFISVRDPFLNPVQVVEGIPMADMKDLVALKLNAVKGRGVKKDFWDVARLLKAYSINQLFEFYIDRYNNDDTFALKRSLTYFDDAEGDIDPISMDGMTWEQVKKSISKALSDYYKNI